MLLAMRVHVTFGAKDTKRDPAYAAALRYLGVEVVAMQDLEYHRSSHPTPAGCRYDLIVVARSEVNGGRRDKKGLVLNLEAVRHWDLPPCAAQLTKTSPHTTPTMHIDVHFQTRHPVKVYDDVFDRLQSVCQSAPKVFDTVDLHFMRENAEVRFKQSHDAKLLKAVFGKNWNAPADKGSVSSQTRELKYIAHSKVTVVVSDVETREIRKFLPDAVLTRISNIHADLASEVTPKGFGSRRGAVFTGNWNHLPNRDAVLWFVAEVLPLVSPRVDSSFVFHVVGANTVPPEILALNHTQMDGQLRVVVHGFVADLKAFYGEMRLSVAPLRWGAGVKGKINSSMK
jgi:hypothetical protein